MTVERQTVNVTSKDDSAQTRAPGVQESELETQPSPSVVLQTAAADPRSVSPAAILQLQRSYGNRAVSNLIQTKLKVGPAGDKYEQEADRIAEQVLRMPSPAAKKPIQRQEDEEEELQLKPLVQRQSEEEEELQMKPLVQRQTPEEEEELQMKPLVQRQAPEEEEELQMKPLPRLRNPIVNRKPEIENPGAGFQTNDAFHRSLSASRGNGSPLPDQLRADFEPKFGVDFGGVRAHSDSNAAQLNRQINAQAFTHGKDIFFGAGKYNPGSSAGKQLIAHELTHTVQQTGGQVKRGSQNQVQPALTNAISRSPSAVVQREVMSTVDWLKATTLSWKSLLQTKERTEELKAIDTALGEYHNYADLINLDDLGDEKKITQANNILRRLYALQQKIGAWEREKGKSIKSMARKSKVKILKDQVKEEVKQIDGIQSAAKRTLEHAEQATVRNQILSENEWEEIKSSNDPKEYADTIFNAFMEYGRDNFTYNFQGRGDLLVNATVGACGSFAMALGALFEYAGIKITGTKQIPEKSFMTVTLDEMKYMDKNKNPGAANVRDRGKKSNPFNRFYFGEHWVLGSEAGDYDPTTGTGPDDESAVAVADFKKAENEKIFTLKKDRHHLISVQESPRKYKYRKKK